MGIIGGDIGVKLLNRVSRGGTVSAFSDIATAYLKTSKLEVLFGPSIWSEIQEKEVLTTATVRCKLVPREVES